MAQGVSRPAVPEWEWETGRGLWLTVNGKEKLVTTRDTGLPQIQYGLSYSWPGAGSGHGTTQNGPILHYAWDERLGIGGYGNSMPGGQGYAPDYGVPRYDGAGWGCGDYHERDGYGGYGRARDDGSGSEPYYTHFTPKVLGELEAIRDLARVR